MVRLGKVWGAARRRVHRATVLLRPPSGHRPGRRQARQDFDKKESDGRDPPQGVAPHVHRGVIGLWQLGE